MIVVNFSTPQYYDRQQRLINSLGDHKSLMLREYGKGWRTHKESPYEFKINAIERAFQLDDVVLWADSSMYLVGDLGEIEKSIECFGYFFQESGHTIGKWCNPSTSKYYNLSEYEAGCPMYVGGLFGLKKGLFEPMEWLKQMESAAEAGCFNGNWGNHRHDMTCGSIIAHRLGLYMHPDHSFVSYMGDGIERTGQVFHYK